LITEESSSTQQVVEENMIIKNVGKY